MNYNELAKKAHQTALDKGWYETERDTNGLLTLILSEFFEAFEAYRKNAYSTKANSILISEHIRGNHKDFKANFRIEVKDTLQDEIADVAIRTLDMAGYYDIEIPEVREVALIDDFSTITKSFTMLISGLYDEQITGTKIAIILGFLEGVASLYKFDLGIHIKLKMAYNELREYRHGNKVL